MVFLLLLVLGQIPFYPGAISFAALLFCHVCYLETDAALRISHPILLLLGTKWILSASKSPAIYCFLNLVTSRPLRQARAALQGSLGLFKTGNYELPIYRIRNQTMRDKSAMDAHVISLFLLKGGDT